MTIKEFWITNISKKNVMLADLKITIEPYKCMNLLVKNTADDKQSVIPNRAKSIHFTKEEYYEELNISDEKFAEENADLNE